MSPRGITCFVRLVLACATVPAGLAQQAGELRNWFNDPFFQVSSDLAGCPEPLGPLATEAERRLQSHHRAEQGTSCWLAGRCERPNDYEYDQGIAAELKAAAAARPQLFAGTTVWVSVQGRVVFMEGCASGPAAAAGLEAFARALPQVQQAVALLRTDPRAVPPYKLRARP